MTSGVYERKKVDPADRFWPKVDKTGDCWLWTRALNDQGYGMFWHQGRMVMAHRFAYGLVAVIPDGLDLDHRHTCPKNCVRPDHLRPATRKQNMENLAGTSLGSSGVRGVSWFARDKKWRGQVKHNYKVHHVGYFDTIGEAEVAVIAKRLELFTHNDADRAAILSP